MSVAVQLPAEPLLRHVRARRSLLELDDATERALDRAAARGHITVKAADVLAVRLLGLTPGEVWGEPYWTAPVNRRSARRR